jgi:GntR family transcriptional regulator, galactonate operon transcriptional repressor
MLKRAFANSIDLVDHVGDRTAVSGGDVDDLTYRGATESSIKSVSRVDSDLRFHCAILAASKNALLLRVGSLIAVGLYISHQISSVSFTVFLPLHKKVFEAIIARDGAKARAATEQLLSEPLEFMSRHLSKKQPRVARTQNLSTA